MSFDSKNITYLQTNRIEASGKETNLAQERVHNLRIITLCVIILSPQPILSPGPSQSSIQW